MNMLYHFINVCNFANLSNRGCLVDIYLIEAVLIFYEQIV